MTFSTLMQTIEPRTAQAPAIATEEARVSTNSEVKARRHTMSASGPPAEPSYGRCRWRTTARGTS
jgi:hypothetical protein